MFRLLPGIFDIVPLRPRGSTPSSGKKYLGCAPVASGWGLEPAEGLAPGSGVSAAHRCLQPHHQAVTGKRPSAGTGFGQFQRCNRRDFCRREPIRACARERSVGCGTRRVAVGGRASDGELQQRSDLLLGRSNCFQDLPRKPDTCGQEGKLTEEVAQCVPIALHPSGEIVHGLTFWTGTGFNLRLGA